jgi:methanogen homocitrate synthase
MDKKNDIAVSPLNGLPEVLNGFTLPEAIGIYDSTLRDGEQMPGVAYTPEQKLCIARKLDEIGIPEIEAGFPAVSKQEIKTVKMIAGSGLNARILVLSRLRLEDIDAARASDADIVLLFIASSPLHLYHKLHVSEQEIKDRMVDSIVYAKDHGIIPSFSTEDSTRTPLSLLEDLIKLAVETGAKRIGFTDTVGCATPQTITYLFSHMRSVVATPFSAHLHNDFGLALVNALAALHAGAQHICTTVNGWGERAGNVSLEQLVMVLQMLYNKNLGIDTTGLCELSQMVSTYARVPVPQMQPWVGSHIFTHESGIHAAAILENPRTYEAIAPELVGNTRHLVFGKHSGRHVLSWKLQELGISADETMVQSIMTKVKESDTLQGEVTDEVIMQIADEVKRGLSHD